jgi:hypothetical protein
MIKQTILISALALFASSATHAAPKPKAAPKATPRPVAQRPEWQKLVTDHGASVVRLKYILKVKTPKQGDQSAESEAVGLMIDPGGLLLVSNARLGGLSAAARKVASGFSASASDLKVLIGDDTEGLPAQLIARDSELDLAWVQIKDAAGKTFASVDLAAEAQPFPGDTLLLLERTSNFLGRGVFADDLHAVGTTDRPRNLLLVTGLGNSSVAPVFSVGGQFVGVTVNQFPDEPESRMHVGVTPGLVLPVHDLSLATKRARDQAARDQAAAKEQVKDFEHDGGP